MNDTKVQRYTIKGDWYAADDSLGRYIRHDDHASIVAEKDNRIEVLVVDNAELRQAINEQAESLLEKIDLLAKYQRLHAADVALDSLSGHDAPCDTYFEAQEARRLALESLAPDHCVNVRNMVPEALVSEAGDHRDAGLYIKGWNDCRKAMLTHPQEPTK